MPLKAVIDFAGRRRQIDVDRVFDRLLDIEEVPRVEADRHFGNGALDLSSRFGRRLPLDGVRIRSYSALREVRGVECREGAAKARTSINEVVLAPEVFEAVGGRGTGQAYEAFHFCESNVSETLRPHAAASS